MEHFEDLKDPSSSSMIFPSIFGLPLFRITSAAIPHFMAMTREDVLAIKELR